MVGVACIVPAAADVFSPPAHPGGRGGLPRWRRFAVTRLAAFCRTLRFQLTAMVVLTVAVVLATSQWMDTSLSTREHARDLRERALLALRIADSLWGRMPRHALLATLQAVVQKTPEIDAIDLFRTEAGTPVLVMSTRATPPTSPLLGPAQLARLARSPGGFALPEGLDKTQRIAVPITRGGTMIGFADADMSLRAVAAFHQRMRTIDVRFLVLSVVLISVVLSWVLGRRVTRPVAALVHGMQRAEAGALHARLGRIGKGEFAYLAASFDLMIARIEDLTSGLESRVREATRDLADKNRELQEANAKLWQARIDVVRGERFAALGQMAATIAHQLGTPLNSVLGYTQLLLREDLPAPQVAKLRIVESQVERMIETIRSVLSHTRDPSLKSTPVAIAPLVADTLVLVSGRLASLGVNLRREVPPDLPTVPGDEIGLRQVLMNLLTNAIDASAAGGTITVQAAVVAGNGRRDRCLELAVGDTGQGMAPEQLQHIFEPFYTTKEEGRGTGLGLAIAYHIVRAHGGHLLADSAPGRGTTMRVQLPLERS
jgi:signal transduction histidine kinase